MGLWLGACGLWLGAWVHGAMTLWGYGAVGAVGLEMGETNGAHKDGQSELETRKGGGGNGGNGLGAVALWGCATVRIEFGVCGLGLGLGAWC